MPTALLLEDEPLLREGLKTALAKLWPELQIVFETGDGDEAMARLLDDRPDIAFLDIQVPGCTGIDIARQFSGRLHIVFVTAHDEHAIEAFERGAVDYVLKPLQPLRLATTIERLRTRLRSNNSNNSNDSNASNASANPGPLDVRPALDLLPAAAAAPAAGARWLQATVGNQTKLIPLREVLYLQSDSKYTRIVRARDEALVRRSLSDLMQVVDPQVFWQIHRSTLVNVEHVDAVVRDSFGGMELVLKGRNERLQVSRAHRPLFKGM